MFWWNNYCFEIEWANNTQALTVNGSAWQNLNGFCWFRFLLYFLELSFNSMIDNGIKYRAVSLTISNPQFPFVLNITQRKNIYLKIFNSVSFVAIPSISYRQNHLNFMHWNDSPYDTLSLAHTPKERENMIFFAH